MTAQIHYLPQPSGGTPELSAASAARLLAVASALIRMGPAMATSIECVGVDGAPELVTRAAERIAASLDLVATVKTTPLMTVRFTRR